ncbi:DUF4173 domain-containing protein [Ferruginibacter lapsinanis]|uniref:DUF4153 domain-containing protein n=1 Tax=Ferruginibacter lapsinanis TaxID=563172 RepID=UPI001E36EC84|nr:DUF4173 domain-containing protein [Ferruginibacter lapsinanis]UEG51184.1 DUF4173 domain-containing protein [Ferruginibacter lapsinanis]
MKKASLKIVLVSAGAILFNILFWQEKMALNTLLFTAFILSALFALYPTSLKQPTMKWLLAAHIVTLAAVVIQNTLLSKLAFSVSLLLVIVFAQYLHRSVWYAGASAITNFIMMIHSFLENIQLMREGKFKLKGVGKMFRFLVIPLILVFVFFLLYNFANAAFQDLMNDVGIALQIFFSKLFTWFSWQRFGFLLLGLFVTGGLLLRSNISYFSELDVKKHNDLWRQKNDLKEWKKSYWFELLSLLMGRFANGVMALRNENITGIISLMLLNVLLFCINYLDIVYVWFGFTYKNNINPSEYVHEGTGLLIFSIVLAMALLLFFFRGNLNFYKKNKWLKYGAYAWLFQNAVLVVSVLFRDYYYIAHMGLAYKRIGVLVFLLLVLVGLITVFIKIHQRKTTYYLLRVNAWFAIIVLVVASCIHWDETIAKYNLARKNTVLLDVKFLLTLSDKTLPVLEKNMDVLDKAGVKIPGSEGEYLYRSVLTPREVFEIRKKVFLQQQQTYSWLSWNAADSYVKESFSKTTLSYSLK